MKKSKAISLIMLVPILAVAAEVLPDMAAYLAEANTLASRISDETAKKSLLEKVALQKKLIEEAGENWVSKDLLYQFLAVDYSKLGMHAAAIKSWDLRNMSSPPLNDLSGYVLSDAVASLAVAAESRNIVMVSEAHHVAQHRVLTYRLLKPLWEKGYRYLAVEALDDKAEKDIANGVIKMSSAAYYTETTFANLLLEARDQGFRIISYDSSIPNSLEGRDIVAAENIISKTFALDAGAKILIHAGFGHIEETGGRLAYQLKEKTGFDALTINQTQFIERSSRDLENPAITRVLDSARSQNPFVFTDEYGNFWSDVVEKYDVAVFWPRTTYHLGRPEWARLGREALVIDNSWCNASFPCKVEVFRQYIANEVASDRIIVTDSEDVKSVFIDNEDTVIVVKDGNDQIIRKIQL